MKGIVYTGGGTTDAFEIRTKSTPKPGAGEVLIKVIASSVNVTDAMRFSLPKPIVALMDKAMGAVGKPLGGEVSGIVTEVGPDVVGFGAGDEVLAHIGMVGGWAEYAVAPVKYTRIKPASLSFAQASALLLAGLPAQGAVQAAHVKAGDRVLINGGSGGVGHLAVQLAHSLGAEVTAVVGPRNLELARAWGADTVIDYSTDSIVGTGPYDSIIAVNGYNPIGVYKALLAPDGIVVPVGASSNALLKMMGSMVTGPLALLGSGKKLRTTAFVSELKGPKIDSLVLAASEGKAVPYVDHVYSLEEASAAMQYMSHVHAQGKVVLSPEPSAAL